jgi:serine/threonine protein kinase
MFDDITKILMPLATCDFNSGLLRKISFSKNLFDKSRLKIVLWQIVCAICFLHSKGIVHGDIKPSNILMSATGPRVIDFGISFSSDATALTRTGMVAGTPTWFAPEQFQGTKITTAVDNFAAGSTLYFAATGSSPWGKEDTSVANTMNQILTKEPDLSQLTPNQRTIISQLLDKNPKNRITANDCVGLIEGIKNSTQLGGEPPKVGKGKRKLVFALVAGVLIASAGLGFTFLSPKSETPVVKPEPIETQWSAKIAGDTNSQTGTGDKFSIYLCDQSVIANSLVVKELTNPPTDPKAKVKVIKGDERCGSEFDTIVVSGPVNFDKKNRDYVVAGSTSSGFLIQYEFSIKEKRQA